MDSITCTRCGRSDFVSLCKHCDSSIEEIKATARAEAAEKAVFWVDNNAQPLAGGTFDRNDYDKLRATILADKQEPPQ